MVGAHQSIQPANQSQFWLKPSVFRFAFDQSRAQSLSMADYAKWSKDGEVLLPCRVVGIAVEVLCEKEVVQDISTLTPDTCEQVEMWRTKVSCADGSWSDPGTRRVPLCTKHQSLALYLVHRLYGYIAGLGLAVAAAVQPKTRQEGRGHHDLVLKHAGHLCQGPFLCEGFLATELKVRQVGADGRGFQAAWTGAKKFNTESLAKVLQVAKPRFGATLLFMIGICDDEALMATKPPLIVRAQMLVLGDDRKAKWSSVLLDKGVLPVEVPAPPPKRQRIGRSWDEVRAQLVGKWADIEDNCVECVRVLDLYRAIDPQKVAKCPGQKIETYEKHLKLKRGEDYFQKSYPSRGRGSEPYWLTFGAAQAVYVYEVHGRIVAVV